MQATALSKLILLFRWKSKISLLNALLSDGKAKLVCLRRLLSDGKAKSACLRRLLVSGNLSLKAVDCSKAVACLQQEHVKKQTSLSCQLFHISTNLLIYYNSVMYLVKDFSLD